ncbi:MAG: hypothetical protein J5710_04325 [Treponema sp.]|nr:hypothetical protein [Treponema sp.]
MKKTFTIIYSVLVSLILIFAITFFAVNIYNENAHGDLRTQVRFEKIVNGVKTAFEKNNISNSEKIRMIENTIGDTKDFSFITISLDGKSFYVYPEGFESFEENSSKLVIIYNRTINANGSKIIITSGLYSLRPSTIFEYAKISFFIILIVSLLTLILIIYNNHFGKDKNEKVYTKAKPKKQIEETEEIEYEEDDEDFEEASDDDSIDENDDDGINKNDDLEETDSVEKINIVEDNVVVEEKTTEEENLVEKKESISEELPVKDFEPVEIKQEEKSVSENGLFSPDTGLGWESYLMTRLENELNRATASELDLALFIIKLDGIGRKNPVMKKICDYLTVEFQFKDLLFEYKDDSICGIKISMNIDSAITFAEKLINEIKKIAGDEIQTVSVGITTRGIRMVTSERLIKEADEAVKHAMEDPSSPVVGFRADAVKYRKFLEKN